jgi:hypothetical protein
VPTTLTHPEPPLTPADHARFDAWFKREASLPEIARDLALPVVELADWAAQPHIRARLAAVKQVAQDRNDLLHVDAKHHALFRLTTLVRLSDNNESARKAATRILMTRLDDPPPRQTAARPSPSLDASTPPAIHPAQLPQDFSSLLDHLMPPASTPSPLPDFTPVNQELHARQPAPSVIAPPAPFPTQSLLAPAETLPAAFDTPRRSNRLSPSSLLRSAGTTTTRAPHSTRRDSS